METRVYLQELKHGQTVSHATNRQTASQTEFINHFQLYWKVLETVYLSKKELKFD